MDNVYGFLMMKSFHSTLPLLASASGQRTFAEPIEIGDDSDEEEENSKNLENDNSLRLWWLYPSSSNINRDDVTIAVEGIN